MTENEKRYVTIWLNTGVVLVIFMVVVGGITRLTGSGLSIVQWNVVTGTLPPLSAEAWEEAFAQYKTSPQFALINKHFALSDFKEIYWWEYFHRLTGRVIGFVFIIPFTIFLIRKILPAWLLKRLLLILLLGGLQGLMGWLMVKSGLQDLPYVSHYKLAIHLSLAFLLIGTIQWTILKIKYNNTPDHQIADNTTVWLVYSALILLMVQIILGAFVAGLKAGYYYNTYPLMGGRLVPENIFASVHNGVLIQFLHRWFAWTVPIVVVILWWLHRKSEYLNLRRCVQLLLIFVMVQVALGIVTLILKVPILLGVLHQLGAVVVFMLMMRLLFYSQHHLPADGSDATQKS